MSSRWNRTKIILSQSRRSIKKCIVCTSIFTLRENRDLEIVISGGGVNTRNTSIFISIKMSTQSKKYGVGWDSSFYRGPILLFFCFAIKSVYKDCENKYKSTKIILLKYERLYIYKKYILAKHRLPLFLWYRLLFFIKTIFTKRYCHMAVVRFFLIKINIKFLAYIFKKNLVFAAFFL